MSTENAGAEAPRQIKVSDIILMLEQGKTREDIRTTLGLNKAQLAGIFKNPHLKGRKTHVSRRLPFELVDDVAESSTTGAAATGTATEATAETASTGRRNRTATQETAAPAAADATEHVEATEEEQTDTNAWNREA